jgi:hypothetical protein
LKVKKVKSIAGEKRNRKKERWNTRRTEQVRNREGEKRNRKKERWNRRGQSGIR